MANVAHSTLTGADLHEPKGTAAAAANTVYVANGSGSGTWTNIAVAAGTTAFGTNGGRLSLATGVTEHVAAVSAATSIFWVPWSSQQISLYSSGSWSVYSVTEKSIALSVTQSCTTVSGNTTITVADSSVIFVGMAVSGSNIQAATTVASITDATHVVMSLSASGNGTNNITYKFAANTGIDVFGYVSSGTMALFLVARSGIFTPTTLTTQDGVPVKSGDTTKRHLGVVLTSATAGQADYGLSGQYRYSVWNRYNRLYREHTEAFSGTGTWYKSLCTTRIKSDIAGGSGNGGVSTIGGATAAGISQGGQGGAGGRSIKRIYPAALGTSETVTIGAAASTTSFGAHHSALGGNTGGTGAVVGGANAGAPGAHGAGSGGDINFTGHGPAGGMPQSMSMDGNGAASWVTNVGSAQAGLAGWAIIDEIVEI